MACFNIHECFILHVHNHEHTCTHIYMCVHVHARAHTCTQNVAIIFLKSSFVRQLEEHMPSMCKTLGLTLRIKGKGTHLQFQNCRSKVQGHPRCLVSLRPSCNTPCLRKSFVLKKGHLGGWRDDLVLGALVLPEDPYMVPKCISGSS